MGTRKPTATLTSFLPIAAEGMSRSTAENYKTAVRSFFRFRGGKDVSLAAMNTEDMRQYERWLREEGVCPNTSSCYLRSLRAIYNKAVAHRQVKDKKPFRNLFTGNDCTVKRSIGKADIRRLQSLQLPEGSRLRVARDLFLFSFYAMGMPLIDVAHLKTSQLKNRSICYCRQKTGRSVNVRIEKCMQQLIDTYRHDNSDYVFPILQRRQNYRGKQQRDGNRDSETFAYATYLTAYNRNLKQIAKLAGISTPLTSYTPRHTWASLAYQSNVSLPVISKALGHAHTNTTLVYISGINDERLANANEKLLREFLFTPLAKRWQVRLYNINSLQND